MYYSPLLVITPSIIVVFIKKTTRAKAPLACMKLENTQEDLTRNIGCVSSDSVQMIICYKHHFTVERYSGVSNWIQKVKTHISEDIITKNA